MIFSDFVPLNSLVMQTISQLQINKMLITIK